MARELTNDDYKNMLVDLLQIDSGLSDWEVNFIETLSKRVTDWYPKQKDKVVEIWTEHCANINTVN